MATLFNSLLFRVGALFLFAMAAIQVAIFAAVLWPDGRPMVFRLIDPAEVVEIAQALEAADERQQPLVVAAVNNGAIIVELLPGFPEGADRHEQLRYAPRLQRQFANFTPELEGRELRVQVRERYLPREGELLQGPIRLLVELQTGQVMAIERAPIILQAIASRYMAVAGVIVVILVALLLVLVWQVIRPISRLAKATHAFREDMNAADVAVSGAREIRELAEAFNAMKGRIGGLVSERTRVLAAIAHDLRTYITRLRLRADCISDDELRDKAVADLEEMSQLLEDVLLFARGDAADKQCVPVIDARSAMLGYAALRRETGDPVTGKAEQETITCRCAPLAFRRILGNLTDNAIRYGKRADLALRRDIDFVVLTVEDEGPGIPQGKMEALTEPFERLEPSRGRSTGGAGLGLAIVKALAEAHGGTLSLENRMGGGLRATVRLPSGDLFERTGR